MIDAERRLLARALMDRDNQFFVLLSERCVGAQHDIWSTFGVLVLLFFHPDFKKIGRID